MKEEQFEILDLVNEWNKLLTTQLTQTAAKFYCRCIMEEDKITILVYLTTIWGDNTNYEGLVKCLFNKICDRTQCNTTVSMENDCIRIEIEEE